MIKKLSPYVVTTTVVAALAASAAYAGSNETMKKILDRGKNRGGRQS